MPNYAAPARQAPSGARAGIRPGLLNPGAKPTYPELAQRRREQGAVRLTFTCNENGQIGDIAVVGSSRSLTLDQAATRFLASQSCVKAAGTFDATYGFELPDD